MVDCYPTAFVPYGTRQIVKSWDAYIVTLPTVTLTHSNPSPRSAWFTSRYYQIFCPHIHTPAPLADLRKRTKRNPTMTSYVAVDRIMVMLKGPPPLLRQRRRSCGPHAARYQTKDNTQTRPLPFYLTAAKVSASSLSELCAIKGGRRVNVWTGYLTISAREPRPTVG